MGREENGTEDKIRAGAASPLCCSRWRAATSARGPWACPGPSSLLAPSALTHLFGDLASSFVPRALVSPISPSSIGSCFFVYRNAQSSLADPKTEIPNMNSLIQAATVPYFFPCLNVFSPGRVAQSIRARLWAPSLVRPHRRINQ